MVTNNTDESEFGLRLRKFFRACRPENQKFFEEIEGFLREGELYVGFVLRKVCFIYINYVFCSMGPYFTFNISCSEGTFTVRDVDNRELLSKICRDLTFVMKENVVNRVLTLISNTIDLEVSST
jgi:hypothetical protein